MTTKEWLLRAKDIDKEINLLLDEQMSALERATHVTASGGGEVKRTAQGNGTEKKFISYSEYSKVIDERIDKLYDTKHEIIKAINRVDNPTYRRLLIARYLEFRTWEKIAIDMHYSYKHVVHYLHPRALKKLEEIIKCNRM